MGHRLYIPYIVGNDKPVPFLYENIARHVDHERFDVTIYANQREPLTHPSVNESYLSYGWRVRKWVKYAVHALQGQDLLHTGGGPRIRYPISKLAHARNGDLKHVHTFRIDVDPEGSYPTTYKRRFAKMVDVATAVSEHTAGTVEDHFGVSAEVVYNAVDAETFHPDQPRPPLFDDLGIDGPVFLFVGQLVERKRPRDLLGIAEAMPEADFLFLGDGPLRYEIQSEADARENVFAPGRLSKARLPAIYAHATGLVFPSVREGCPNVVLESMAAGTPVVGYDATSMPELIDDGETGLLAPPEDVGELGLCVRELLETDVADAMGEAAREYVEQTHTPEVIVGEYESIYRRLLE